MDYGQPFSHGLPPNRTCPFAGIRLSSVSVRPRSSVSPACMNIEMTSAADHKRFASTCNHGLFPERHGGASLSLEVFQCSYMVDFYIGV